MDVFEVKGGFCESLPSNRWLMWYERFVLLWMAVVTLFDINSS
jgi:hypothetical protein